MSCGEFVPSMRTKTATFSSPVVVLVSGFRVLGAFNPKPLNPNTHTKGGGGWGWDPREDGGGVGARDHR